MWGLDIMLQLNKSGHLGKPEASNTIKRIGEQNKYISKKITIPQFQNKKDKTDSLNISSAAAIICSEFIRRL